MAEPIPVPWAELLDAASRFVRAYGTDDENQALLELAAAIGEIDLLIDRQKRARGELDPPEWLNR